MKFVVVNGRTPRIRSFCALCCESIAESYLRISRRSSSTAVTSATSVTPKFLYSHSNIMRWYHDTPPDVSKYLPQMGLKPQATGLRIVRLARA